MIHSGLKYVGKLMRFHWILVIFMVIWADVQAQNRNTVSIDSLFDIARILSYQNMDSSFVIVDQLICEAKKSGDNIRLGKYYCMKGRSILNKNQNRQESLRYFLLAGEANKIAQDINLEVDINRNLLFYYTKLQNFSEARKYFNNLTETINSPAYNNDLLKSKILNSMGNFYSDLAFFTSVDTHDSDLIYFYKSLEIAKKNHYIDVAAANYINLGVSYYDKGNAQKALENYRMAAEQSALINDTLGLASITFNIGSIYFDDKNYDKALEYYSQARKLYGDHNYNILYMTADAYAGKKQFKLAYQFVKKASNIYDSIHNVEQDKIINNLLIKYETEKKENEIILKDEKIKVTKEKSKNRDLIIAGLVFLIVTIVVVVLFVMQNVKNKNRLLERDVELKNQEINKVLKEQELNSYAALLEGQDQERQRIAADLHDRLGGLLSTVKAYFTIIEEKIDHLEDKTIKQHKKATNLLNTAVDEVRNISYDLHSGVLKNFGLSMALKDLRNTIEMTGKLKVDLLIDGEPKEQNTAHEIQLYRVIQELFSNTLKHAKANQVTLQIVFSAAEINIIFEDDGVGFDTSKTHKGIGLKNIEARVNKMNGKINIDSRTGRGTITIINIPYHD